MFFLSFKDSLLTCLLFAELSESEELPDPLDEEEEEPEDEEEEEELDPEVLLLNLGLGGILKAYLCHNSYENHCHFISCTQKAC